MTTAAISGERKKVTVPDLALMKDEHRKIAMVTAYDVTFARLVDQAGVDVILVGDSLGMVVQGHDNTIPVDSRRDGLPHSRWSPGPGSRRWSSAICRSARTRSAPSRRSRARSG